MLAHGLYWRYLLVDINTKAGFIQDQKPHFPIIQNLRRVKSVEITNQISEQFLFKVSLPH